MYEQEITIIKEKLAQIENQMGQGVYNEALKEEYDQLQQQLTDLIKLQKHEEEVSKTQNKIDNTLNSTKSKDNVTFFIGLAILGYLVLKKK